MSEFKVGDEVFIKAKIVKKRDGVPGYLVVPNGDLESHWESKVYPIQDKTYEDGINEAWELAKRIIMLPSIGGFTLEETREIFNKDELETFEYNAQEALDMFREWNNKKEIHAKEKRMMDSKICRPNISTWKGKSL